jgi:hypothetical protein
MPGFLVILGKLFANLSGRRPDNVVCARVVVDLAGKDLYSQSALFKRLWIPLQTVLNDVAQQALTPVTAFEKVVRQDSFQLLLNRGWFDSTDWHPFCL